MVISPTIAAIIKIAAEAAISQAFLDIEGKTEREMDEILVKKRAEKAELDARLAAH